MLTPQQVGAGACTAGAAAPWPSTFEGRLLAGGSRRYGTCTETYERSMPPLPGRVLAMPAGFGPILAAPLPKAATVCSRSQCSKGSAHERLLTPDHQCPGCAARLRSCTHSAMEPLDSTLERRLLAGHAAGARCAAAVGAAPADGLAVDMRGVSVVVGEGDKRKEVTLLLHSLSAGRWCSAPVDARWPAS